MCVRRCESERLEQSVLDLLPYCQDIGACRRKRESDVMVVRSRHRQANTSAYVLTTRGKIDESRIFSSSPCARQCPQSESGTGERRGDGRELTVVAFSGTDLIDVNQPPASVHRSLLRTLASFTDFTANPFLALACFQSSRYPVILQTPLIKINRQSIVYGQ